MMTWNHNITNYADIAGIPTIANIFNIILHSGDGITRADLSRLTGFSKSTITHHVSRLLQTGFVIERDMPGNENMRKSQVLMLNNENGYILGIDLGATSLNVGVCTLRGKPLGVTYNKDINVHDGPEIILGNVIKICRQQLESHKIAVSQVLGIGMGIVSAVEFPSGRPIAPIILNGWDAYPIRERLARDFSCQIFLDNDVNLMALAENINVSEKASRNFIFVKLGIGISCSIFCNGGIYRGSSGGAGDIGHISVDGCNLICKCGNKGCLEAVAGGEAIEKEAERMAKSGESKYLSSCLLRGEKIDARTVQDAINSGDRVCMDYIRSLGYYIGEVIAKIVNFYNPDTVIFGGGISNFNEILLEPVRKTVFNRSSALAAKNLTIRRSILGEDAGVIGAAVLARDEYFKLKEFNRFLKNVK
jgi:glucokinase-like ROK family protein